MDVERKGNLLEESRSEADGFFSHTFDGEKNLAVLKLSPMLIGKDRRAIKCSIKGIVPRYEG